MADKTPEDKNDSLSISWSDTIRFIKQLTHDLRNELSAIELQSANISQLGENEEFKNELKRLREMVSALAPTLPRLPGAVGDVSPTQISYRAADSMEALRTRI